MSIAELIEAHRAAVMADEANFTDDFEPIDPVAAEASHGVEIAAYRALVAAPCGNAAEVQQKIRYLLNGNVGARTPLVELLIEGCYCPDENYAGLLPALLQSMVLEARA